MGQYHFCVSLDNREFLHPHNLGAGLKLWEQLANQPGVGAALIVLLASASNGAGGGDLQKDENKMVGRWRGHRIVFVGDYDDASEYDVHGQKMSGNQIYSACSDGERALPPPLHFVDISKKVRKCIEKELDGKFVGTGWCKWKPNEKDWAEKHLRDIVSKTNADHWAAIDEARKVIARIDNLATFN